jgi:hypothetical protein
MHPSRILRPALLALALWAAPCAAAAQIGNQSDHTGPVVTGGMMGFLPQVTRPTRNAPLVDRNGRIRYGSQRVACAVSVAADSLLAGLREGRLEPGRAFQGFAIPPATERALARILRPVTGEDADTAAFAAGLAGDAATDASRALAHALYGLMDGRESCGAGEGTVPAPRLAAAFAAYDAFVASAPQGVLSAPGAELLATQAVLERLANAAVDAAG